MTVSTSTTGPEAAPDRRARASRPSGARADRLPPPPRERRPLLAAFAVLLIVGGAAVAGLLALRADSRVPVLVATADIVAGQRITAEHLGTTPVASEGTLLLPAGQHDLVVGQYARRSISAGQLLDTSMLTTSGMLTEGKVAVGAALAAGRVPASGLQPGDVVQLVRVLDGEGTVLVREALVSSASRSSDSPGGATVTATFIVEDSEGPVVAGVGAEGQLAAVLMTRGAAVDGDG
ncbi:hypothetical protein J1G42_02490 [Cellulomonas sp. zg-ZUI222]|uniref:SAF domain-containing protein n=1 Tax=Cellulomonas wangleii TaxID=2816956 RepID=A0ABX8D5S5_9CELL|nr:MULTISPECIES: SAF domain-containing protein [Cellulomonas]MBO0898830.1 hypothetical protein [Cellulomonas sp. zg-ZUI22]MBO0919692.1 hypothetical protein [Cellulomonas wangleii]MBO0923881.1 hypothetical protein [Cellulomonas wangleii]MBO0924163.1 hypothetical protein [Cellulomonas wangleii]QVI62185.1 hypothetical protein KG103_17515 [Cellulomonas wangleii]